MLGRFRFDKKHLFRLAIPSVLLVLMSVFIFRFNTYAVARTWDGGGTDGTCGGVAGDGNKWSCAANWTGDVMPTSADTITFDATSTKNATIDAGFGGALTSLTIAATYSGTITQARSLTVSGAYSQAAGAFVGSADALTVNGTSTLSGGTFDGGTGTHTYGATVYSGATFTKASGAVTYNSTFTLSGSAFTASSGITAFKGDFTHTSGTFTHNNGSVVFGQSVYSNIYATASNLAFYDVEFSMTSISYGWTISSGDDLSVIHNLTLTNGYLYGPGTVTVGTNTAVPRTVTQTAGFGGGSAIISVTGTDAIAVTFNADADTATGMTGFTLNNANATITNSGATGNMEFEAAVTVTAGTFECPTAGPGCQFESTLTLNGGTFNANSSTLSVASTGVFSSGIFNGGTGSNTYTSAVTYSGATFTKASGAVTYNSTFGLSGGSYSASSGTTNFKDNFTHTAGTFTHNNGSVVFGQVGYSNTYNTASNLAFYDVEFSMTSISYGWTISSGDDLSVIHNLTLTNGYLYGPGTVTVGTNTAVPRTVTQTAGFGGGSAIISVTGTDAIAVTFNADADTATGMTGFTLNNANATVTIGGSSGTMEFEGAVTVTNGTLTAATGGPATLYETTLTVNGGTYIAASSAHTFTGATTFSSGSFDGGTGTVTYNSTFTLSGSAFTASSWITTFKGDFTHTSGTFTHNNGSVVFGQSGYSNIYATASNLAFYDVEFNMTSVSYGWTISTGDDLSVTHNLTLTNGFVNGSGTVTVGTNTAVSRTVTQTAGFGGGSAIISVTGTDAIAVTFNADADTATGMTGFTLNNANATITNSGATGNMEFEAAVTVTAGTFECPTAGPGCQFESTLTLNGGTFNANSAALSVASTGTFSSGIFNGGTGSNTYTSAVTYSGATFTKASGAVTYNNTFTLSGSAFTASSGTSSFNGDFTHTVGTFTHNSGLVVFGSTANAYYTYNTASALTFYDVEFNHTHSTGTGGRIISAGDILAVAHNLILTKGTISSGTVEVGTNTGVSRTVTQAAGFDGGIGVVVVSGTDAISIVLNADTDTNTAFPGLTLDNVNATFSNNGALGNQEFEGTVTVTAGTFDCPTTGPGCQFEALLSLNGGTFNASTGTTTFGFGFTHTSGTWTHNNGLVQFTGGNYQTYNSASTLTFYDLEISSFSWNMSSDTIAVARNLTLTNGVIDSGTLNVSGNVTVVSTWDGGSAALTFTGAGNTQTFTLATAGLFNGNITVNKTSGSVNLASALTLDAASQTLTITSGTLDLAGFALIVNGTLSTVAVAAAGTFQLQGGETTTFLASNPTLSTGSTVAYTGTVGPYTLKPWSYKNLTLNGTAAFSAGAATVVAGTLTINPSNILDLAGFNLTGAGTISNTGTLRLQGGETVTMTQDTDSGTMEFNGTGNYTVTPGTLPFTTFYNVTFNGAAGQWKSSTSFDANGSLTVSNGTYTPPAAATVAGDIAVSVGTLASTGTALILDGTDQIVNGTFTVASLAKNVTVARTLTLGAGKTLTVTGATSLTGSSTGTRLSLRSSIPTTAASLDMQGSKILQYLSVSDNTAVTAALCIVGCEQGSNVTNWTFTASVVIAESAGTTTVTEGGATDSYTLVLNAAPSSDVTVTLSPDDDVTLSASVFTFTALNWDSAQTVTVAAVDDALDETSPETAPVSTVTSSVDAAFHALSVSDVSVAVTDNDDPPTVQWTLDEQDTTEDAGDVTVTAQLSAVSSLAATIPFTFSGTADITDDFTASPASELTINAGSTTAVLTISLVDDTDRESIETIIATIGSPTNATASGTTVHTVNVTDNESGGGGSSTPVSPTPGPLTSSVALLKPNGGERFLTGETVFITWDITGRVDLVDLSWSADGGDTWSSIVTAYPNHTFHAWTPPVGTASADVLVRVDATDLAFVYATDQSDAPFSIGSVSEDVSEPTEPVALPLPFFAVSPITGLWQSVATLFPGNLVRSPSFPAVYVITGDGHRRPFVDEQTFFTYEPDFSRVKVVSDATLPLLPMGPPMLPKPGAKLVKIQSDPKVYAVEENPDDLIRFLLRHVPDETTAQRLFGPSWNRNVLDIPVTLFGRFVVGRPLE